MLIGDFCASFTRIFVIWYIISIERFQPLHGFCLIGNPSWKGKPTINPVKEDLPNLPNIGKRVIVDWNGVIQNAKGDGRDCTDHFVVKYWIRANPTKYIMTEFIESSSRQHQLEGLIPGTPYAIQVIAREDKGPIGGVDYNRSPTVYFSTKGIPPQKLLNGTKHEMSSNERNVSSIAEYKQSFCKRIKESQMNAFTQEKINTTGEDLHMYQKRSKLISSILSSFSSRLNIIEKVLFSLVCSSRNVTKINTELDLNLSERMGKETEQQVHLQQQLQEQQEQQEVKVLAHTTNTTAGNNEE